MLAASLLGQRRYLLRLFYPTAQTPEGYIKKVLNYKQNTGPLGGMFGSPLAAGNFFSETLKCLYLQLKSTLFGVPYNFKTKLPNPLRDILNTKQEKILQ